VRNAAIALGLALAAYLVLVPLAIGVRRLVRRQRATSPPSRVRLWWQEAGERAEASGIVSLPPSLTVAETADQLAAALPGSADAVQRAARAIERLAYAEESPTTEQVAEARRAWTSVRSEAASIAQ
jgi:hypothetical protein